MYFGSKGEYEAIKKTKNAEIPHKTIKNNELFRGLFETDYEWYPPRNTNGYEMLAYRRSYDDSNNRKVVLYDSLWEFNLNEDNEIMGSWFK